MRYFMDEEGNIISEHQLMREFALLAMNYETECMTFAEYVRNCTDKNGTLTEI